MNQDQIDRDRLLSEISRDVRYIRDWADKHEKDDNRRFLWAFIAIILLSGFTGFIPQILGALRIGV